MYTNPLLFLRLAVGRATREEEEKMERGENRNPGRGFMDERGTEKEETTKGMMVGKNGAQRRLAKHVQERNEVRKLTIDGLK